MTANPIITPNDARLLGPTDHIRIDVDAPAEMRHWVRELGRPAAQLKAAVQEVGPWFRTCANICRNARCMGRCDDSHQTLHLDL
jgi:hypothetical protein